MGHGASLPVRAVREGRPSWPRLTVPLPTSETEALAWRLRASSGTGSGRVDVEALCRSAGCQVSLGSLRGANGGLQGLLIPTKPGRFKMIVDGQPPGLETTSAKLKAALLRHRRRFIMAHELGHTFFFSWRGARGYQHHPPGPEQERFCDEFARALLVPPRLVARYQARADSVPAIQRRFDVSMEVAVRSLSASHGRGLFSALLLRLEDGPDLTRPQWRDPHDNPSGRWWSGALIEEAIATGRARGSLAWADGRSSTAEACCLPKRRQVIITARRPD